MSVDWSKYPTLPEAPQLPDWHDTPEREAYWQELQSIKHPMSRKLSHIIFWAGLLILTILVSVMSGISRCGDAFVDFFTFAGIGIVVSAPFLIVWTLIYGVWFQILQIKMSMRYGFYMTKLKHRDISPEIGEVLAARPVFDENIFRQYWPSAELSETALLILRMMSDNWRLHNKMLYPNDPLSLFFYGKEGILGKNKSIDPECFLEDLYIDMNYDEWDKIDCDTTFAELVEGCMKSAKSS